MPNLKGSNSKPRRKLDLGEEEEEEREKTPPKSKPARPKVNKPKKSNQIFALEDEDDDSEDEEVSVSKSSNNAGNPTVKILLGAGIVVVVAIIGFMFVMRKPPKQEEIPKPPVTTQQQQQPKPVTPQQQQTQQQAQTQTQPNVDDRLGIQDFTTNTTMKTDDVLGDGDNVTSDLFGLTTRVDYTVSDVYYTTDFVNYTKRRATWGGGLELYYLDCEYRGSKYMVQVPFKYYKELDDVGIVTVKMEVLRIKGGAEDDTRSIVSYMELDEAVLKAVQKSKTNKKY